jgi:hypothetical protein
MLRPHTEERLAQVQAALQEELRASQPELRNLEPAAELFGEAVLEYRGRRFRVPPVPFAFGVALVGLQERIRRMQDAPEGADTLAELHAVLREAVALFPRLVRHTGWRRPLGRLLPNPFRAASEFEVGELLGFFSGCRMMSRVRHPRAATDRPHPRT